MNSAPIRALGLLLCAQLSACGESDPDRLSGIIITVDTTNRPALGVYGKRRATTPNLDALAGESLIYDQARTVAPVTLPSHASMMTGLYPTRHQVRDNGLNPLSPAAETLAELAGREGYQTGAFISALPLSAMFGLAQGFEVYDEPPSGARGARGARDTTRAAIAWLDGLEASRPMLLWVHYYDPHAPYTPEPEYLRQIARDGPAMVAEYLAEIAQMDASIGTLVAHMRKTGWLSRSLVAVVADHGESLGRNGELTHSFLTYDSVMRVPMFLRYPDGYRAGERSGEIVSVVDVFPTFASALKLPPVQDQDGENLFKSGVAPDRGVYFESFVGFLNCGWSPLAGWADARGTYIHGSEPEFFAASDELQQRNLIAQAAEQIKAYRARIGQVAGRPTLPRAEAALDDDTRARIQELGYLGQADPTVKVPHPLEPTDLPSPQRHIQEIGPYLQASVLGLEGKTEEAIAVLREMLAATPDNTLALQMLGGLLHGRKQYQEALTVLERAVALRPDMLAVVGQLARTLEDLDRPQQALEVYLSGCDRWPGETRFLSGAVRVLERLGQTEEAARLRRRLEG